jgi:hypothetical protein
MEEDAPAPQHGGRRRSVVISQNEYDFLRGANQRLEMNMTPFYFLFVFSTLSKR